MENGHHRAIECTSSQWELGASATTNRKELLGAASAQFLISIISTLRSRYVHNRSRTQIKHWKLQYLFHKSFLISYFIRISKKGAHSLTGLEAAAWKLQKSLKAFKRLRLLTNRPPRWLKWSTIWRIQNGYTHTGRRMESLASFHFDQVCFNIKHVTLFEKKKFDFERFLLNERFFKLVSDYVVVNQSAILKSLRFYNKKSLCLSCLLLLWRKCEEFFFKYVWKEFHHLRSFQQEHNQRIFRLLYTFATKKYLRSVYYYSFCSANRAKLL